jgi:hypothetical protein
MRQKHSLLGIISIIFSIQFYILARLLFYTDRLDIFYPQNFLFAFPAIFIALPALAVGFSIAALRQKSRNKLLAYLGAIIALPVLLVSLYWSTITILYMTLPLFSRR